jgi:hypothetical protein
VGGGVRPDFADLPDYLRAEIAAEWNVLEVEAAGWFDTLTADGRWKIITAFLATSGHAQLQAYLAQADAMALRDLGHLILARSRALQSV